MPSGRNNGSITEDMNSTVINGTPRQNSMKVTQTTRIAGMFERRPSARTIPSGNAPAIPTVAITRVSIRPPHWLVATASRPNTPPCSRHQAMIGYSTRKLSPYTALW
ncbi:hypothetical protein D3C86_1586680 [compost metagenome]